MSGKEAASSDPYGPGVITQLLVLLGLTGFAIAEPVLTIFGADPGTFYFHTIESRELIILYALSVAFLPPLILWIFSLVIGLVNRGFAAVVHYLFVGALAALWLIQLLTWNYSINVPAVIVALSLLGGIIFIYAYIKLPMLQGWLQMTAIAPVIMVGFFLIFSDVSGIMRKAEPDVSIASSGEKLPPILFIILDEFPTVALLDENGSLDGKRFPNLSKFADQATWYRHYTVLSGETVTSVPTILTGNDPRLAPANLNSFPQNLFTLLAPTHYLTAFEELTRLCDLPECSLGRPGKSIERPEPQIAEFLSKTLSLVLRRISLDPEEAPRQDDFQEKIKVVKTLKKDREKPKDREQPKDGEKSKGKPLAGFFSKNNQAGKAQEKTGRLDEFMDTFVNHLPAIYYLHLQLPHAPWRFYANGELYELPYKRTPFAIMNFDGGEWLRRLTYFRFLQQVEYTDALLGEVFSKLESMGMLDQMLVVVTADHGRSFKANTSIRRLTPRAIDHIAYAPLLVKRPHQEQGSVDDSNMMAYDIVPTIADILGIEIPWEVTGFPAGNAAIAGRGDEKIAFFRTDGIFPVKNENKLGVKSPFSDKEQFPKPIPWLSSSGSTAEDPLAALNASLLIEQFIGRAPESFEVKPGGSAIVDELALLQRPELDKAPLGVVMGNLEFEPAGNTVLIVVNGRIVSGSSLVKFKGVDNTFIALLPPSVLNEHNQIGVYLLEDDGLLELTLSE
jgi:hypothetical protein